MILKLVKVICTKIQLGVYRLLMALLYPGWNFRKILVEFTHDRLDVDEALRYMDVEKNFRKFNPEKPNIGFLCKLNPGILAGASAFHNLYHRGGPVHENFYIQEFERVCDALTPEQRGEALLGLKGLLGACGRTINAAAVSEVKEEKAE